MQQRPAVMTGYASTKWQDLITLPQPGFRVNERLLYD